MRIEAAHTLGVEEVQRRLDDLIKELVGRQWPAGVEVHDIEARWVDERLDFKFLASRGFFNAAVSGHLTVSGTSLVLDVEIPGVVLMFVGENRIREGLEGELRRLLQA
ncbi:MAG: polyhydroxyalkanoic acid system family protein [Acidobacteria bacterium]|jgi:hypothetical protein|nr:polyhydroxyalkanoic acid system family protein [Acidobacteriota bacterium]